MNQKDPEKNQKRSKLTLNKQILQNFSILKEELLARVNGGIMNNGSESCHINDWTAKPSCCPKDGGV